MDDETYVRIGHVGERVKLRDGTVDTVYIRYNDDIWLLNSGRWALPGEYIVMEDDVSETLEYKGVQYRCVQRPANVNELVKIVDNVDEDSHDIPMGTICTIIDVNASDTRDEVRDEINESWYVRKEDYIVLEPVETGVSPVDVDNPTFTALVQRVDELEKHVAELQKHGVGKTIGDYIEEYKQNGDVDLSVFGDLFQPNEALKCYTREQVVEMAKRDVEILPTQFHNHVPFCGDKDNPVFFDPSDANGVRFVVNRSKKTVAALLIDTIYSKHNVWNRAKSKCMPDDCFNVHIGKAIALRRALGLEVPEYYINAPQPTKVNVGDVVAFSTNSQTHYVIDYAYGNSRYDIRLIREVEEPKLGIGWKGHRWLLNEQVVIDDSHDFSGTKG